MHPFPAIRAQARAAVPLIDTALLSRRCVVTQSSYTADEDFSLADAVFECIGDAGDEQFSLHDLTTPGEHSHDVQCSHRLCATHHQVSHNVGQRSAPLLCARRC
jgi:hypothetical protein